MKQHCIKYEWSWDIIVLLHFNTLSADEIIIIR